MRKTYLYMTAVAMSAALAAGCQKAEPAETTAAAETVAESTGTGMAESESSETSGTAAQDDERLDGLSPASGNRDGDGMTKKERLRSKQMTVENM